MAPVVDKKVKLSPLAFSGIAFVIIAALGFSSKGVLIKLAYALDPRIDAIGVMAIRMLLALPFFLVVALRIARHRETAPLIRQDVLAILALGFFGYYASSWLDFTGLKYISASLERLILYLYPSLVVVLSAWYYRRAITRRERHALALGYAGIVLVFVVDLHFVGADVLKGGVLVFVAALSYAVFLIASAHTIQRVGAARFTAYSMTVATALTLIHYFVQHGVQLAYFPAEFYAIGLAMAVFCTVIPAFLMNAGMQRIGAGMTSMLSSVGPVMTIGLAYFVLHEPIAPVQWVGTALIISGVLLLVRRQ